MNKSIAIYILSFGVAVGLFQNCTRQQFASLSSTEAGNQGVTSFDPNPGDSSNPTDSTDPTTPAVIGTIVPKAEPPVVTLGGSTVVSVTTTNVDRIDYVCAVASDLTAAGVFRQGSLTPTDNAFTISPRATSGCRFTGYGSKLSTPVVIDLPIVVKPPDAVVGSLVVKASPSTIALGQSTTISATMSNITSVSYVCAAGLDVSGPVFQQGTLTPNASSFTMSPSQTSTCKFTGTGPNLSGPYIQTLTVIVNRPEPVVGNLVVTANPPAITAGQSTFVNATMTNITSVAVSCAQGADGSGAVFLQSTLTPANPSFALAPTQTSMCKFVGTGPNLANPVIKTLTIVVNPPAPVVGSFDVSANPSTLTRGQSSTVTASGLQNVSSITYSCSADVNGVVFAQGSLSQGNPSTQVAPTQNSTCIFTGTGPNLAAPVTKTLHFTVNDPPPVLVNGSFDVSANPANVTRGEATTVSATSISNLSAIAYTCTYDANGVAFANGTLTPAAPSFPLAPSQTATCNFTGSGVNLAGPATRALRIVVSEPAPVLVNGSFDVSANPATLTRGEGTTVSATGITNLSSISYSCTFDAGGAPFTQGTLTPGAPSFAMSPSQSATCSFNGNGDNLAGPATRSLHVTVNEPAPPPPAQRWTWHGLLYQTTCSPNTWPNCDSVEWATCEGAACRAPKIQCYAATPFGVPVHPEGVTQDSEPTGIFCYLRQANEGWIYR